MLFGAGTFADGAVESGVRFYHKQKEHYLDEHLFGLLMLVTVGSCNAAEQMKVVDLYTMCTSSKPTDKTACTFYILGVFEGAGLVASTVKDKAGTFRDVKEKPFCVPEEMTSTAMELTVKMKMGEDLAVFP